MNRLITAVGLLSILASYSMALGQTSDVPAKGEPRDLAAELKPLAERFVASLQDGNIIGYAQCWLPRQSVCQLLEDTYKLSDEVKLEHERYCLESDRSIALYFPALREELQKLAGDCSLLRLESVEATDLETARTKHNELLEKLGTIVVTVRANKNTLVRIDLDDGIKRGEGWYLSDTPRGIIRIITRMGQEEKSRSVWFHPDKTPRSASPAGDNAEK